MGELKKTHVTGWLESHATWRSPATQRSVLPVVLAAFNRAEQSHHLANPLKGLKKPASRPRVSSFSAAREKALYAATDECFKYFLFAAIHTGLRPFCELARITADDVEETDRGMMWRVYSSKTKKTRKIPVRPEVADLARRLIKTAPRGSGLPLLRNTCRKPWERMTGVARFIAIKKKLGWDKDPVKRGYSCYTCRHTFAHRMLAGYLPQWRSKRSPGRSGIGLFRRWQRSLAAAGMLRCWTAAHRSSWVPAEWQRKQR